MNISLGKVVILATILCSPVFYMLFYISQGKIDLLLFAELTGAILVIGIFTYVFFSIGLYFADKFDL